MKKLLAAVILSLLSLSAFAESGMFRNFYKRKFTGFITYTHVEKGTVVWANLSGSMIYSDDRAYCEMTLTDSARNQTDKLKCTMDFELNIFVSSRVMSGYMKKFAGIDNLAMSESSQLITYGQHGHLAGGSKLQFHTEKNDESYHLGLNFERATSL